MPKRETQSNTEICDIRYKEMFENSRDGFVMIDLEGNITHVNKAFSKLLGYSKKELLSMNFLEFTPLKWHKWEMDEIVKKRLLKNGYSGIYEKEYIKKDGTVIPVELSSFGVFDKNKKPVYLWGSVKDISERKQIESKLKEREERYKTIFEKSPHAIVLIDTKGKIIDTNDRLQEWLGYKTDTIRGTNLKNIPFVPKESKDLGLKMFTNRLKGVENPPYDMVFVSKTGKKIIGQITANLIRDNNDKPLADLMLITDITEQRRAENELSQKQDLLNQVENIAKIGGWEMDIKSGKATWTKGTYDIVEIDPKKPIPGLYEHIGYYLPEYQAEISKAMDNLIKKDIPLDFKAYLKTAKGNIKWCHAIGTSVRKNGKCVTVRGTFQDITEQKEAEEKIRQLNDILEASPVVAFLWKNDEHWTVETVSKNVKELFGYTDQDFLTGKIPFAKIIHPNDLNQVGKEVEAYSKKKHLKQFEQEYRIIGKDHIVKWIADKTTIIRDKNGKITHYQGLVYDITEQKLAEDRYKTIFETSGDAMMTLEPPDWKFTSGNATTVQIFGAKNEADFVSRGPGEYSPEYQPDGNPSNDKAKVMIMKAMKEGSNFFEWNHMRLNGEVFPATVLLTRVESGNKSFLQATVRDITKDKASTERLKYHDVLKTRLISALELIAEEPLEKIRWGLETVIKGDLGELTEKQRTFLQNTLNTDIKISELISDIRLLVDFEQDKITYDKTNISIRDLVGAELAKLEPECRIRQLKCKFIPPKIKIVGINADATMIGHVLKHILQNAIMYSSKGKSITVNMKFDQGLVKVSVKDQGIGIPKSEQKRIFEMFYRASNVQNLNPNGLGTGLYLAKRITEDHNGRIGFTSQEGKGSTFWFEIPIK